VEIISTEPPIPDGYGKNEPATEVEIVKKTGSVMPDTDADTAVAIDINRDFNQNYNIGNHESSNPFLTGFKLWQNYALIWMDFYTRVLDIYMRNASGFLKTRRDNNNNISFSRGTREYVINT
jgi:hypothetical protein